MATGNTVTKTDYYSNKEYIFQNFEDKQNFTDIGEKAYQEELLVKKTLKAINYRDKAPNVTTYGSNDKNFLNKGEFIDYIDKPALESTIDSFDVILDNIDMGGAFKKGRLKITDDKKGIFDFSLASKGLYEKQEYFSIELAQESPLEFENELPGIVPETKIYQDVFNQYFYTSIVTNKKYVLTQQQKGTRAIELGVPNAKLEFATSNKKSYLMFEKKGGKAKMVDLYVVIGGLNDLKSTGMLNRSLPMLLIARYLQSVGIKTRINATRMYSEGDKMICFTYPIKDYGEDLDFNWIAINVADVRWFRWNLWKYTSAIIENKLNKSSNGWGSTIYANETGLNEVFNRYKNWYYDQMQKGLQPELSIDRNLMLIGGLDDPKNTLTPTVTKDVIKEFYRILDTVDFQFNDPEKASERIYKRMVIENGELQYDYKKYVIDILANAYSYPQKGKYATEPERQDVLEDQFDEAEKGLNKFLSSLI